MPKTFDEIISLENTNKAKNVSDTFEPILNNIGKILSGWSSNPITGIPLLAGSSELLYKHLKILPRDIAAIFLSPSALLEIGIDVAKDTGKVVIDTTEDVIDFITQRKNLEIQLLDVRARIVIVLGIISGTAGVAFVLQEVRDELDSLREQETELVQKIKNINSANVVKIPNKTLKDLGIG